MMMSTEGVDILIVDNVSYRSVEESTEKELLRQSEELQRALTSLIHGYAISYDYKAPALIGALLMVAARDSMTCYVEEGALMSKKQYMAEAGRMWDVIEPSTQLALKRIEGEKN